MRQRRIALVVAVAVATSRGAALADPAGDLASARQHYADLDYEQAITDAGKVGGTLGATVEQRIDAQMLAAMAHLALVDPADALGDASQAHQAAAVAALRAILALDWQFELPAGYSGPVAAAFDDARRQDRRARAEEAATACGRPVQLALVTAPHPSGGSALTLRFQLDDAGGCARHVRVVWARDRITAAPAKHEVLAVHGGSARLVLPAELTASSHGLSVLVYAEADADNHGVLAELGSFEQPHRIAIGAGQLPAPIYRRWWFWTAIGAAAIGTAILVDQARDAGPQDIGFEAPP